MVWRGKKHFLGSVVERALRRVAINGGMMGGREEPVVEEGDEEEDRILLSLALAYAMACFLAWVVTHLTLDEENSVNVLSSPLAC